MYMFDHVMFWQGAPSDPGEYGYVHGSGKPSSLREEINLVLPPRSLGEEKTEPAVEPEELQEPEEPAERLPS